MADVDEDASDTNSESDGEIFAAVVIEDGSYIKAGFSGDDEPRAVFPAIVGYPRHRVGKNAPHIRHAAIVHGEEARARAEAERAIRIRAAQRRLALGKLLHARLGAAGAALVNGDMDVLALLAHVCIAHCAPDAFAQEMEVASHVRERVAAAAARLWHPEEGRGPLDDGQDINVGDEAEHWARVSCCPIVRGLVNDWVAMEHIWRHTFLYELRVAPEEQNVLWVEMPMNPKSSRELLARLCFGTFGVPALFIVNTAVLSLFASGRITGIVLTSGDGATTAVPVYEGYSMPHAMLRVDLGGRDLTDYMMRLMNANSADCQLFPTNSADRELVNDIKKKLCFVSRDGSHAAAQTVDEEHSPRAPVRTHSADRAEYEMPDGNTVSICEERFRCPEPLFHPPAIGVDAPGAPELVHLAITRCDPELHEELYGNIVLAGGSTMFDGFANRMQREVAARAPPAVRTRVIAPPERKYSAWIGGSILAELPSSQLMWVTKVEYDEAGPQIVHQKCLH